eukprot:gnl/TRDRNA2_/TRDRNA2_186834_c0_seq1.p1 gnl/TRDRNA2_/TRDRNA2_186834_c0~~gnl/TRDRNA2_/TRDRNA2_186834_c0_seq1.p1  ORF type:complete len:109 (-),score=22.37 gnl/TRDRNA2_/TRDRNA2_186834_c0_seq1:110-436(-)
MVLSFLALVSIVGQTVLHAAATGNATAAAATEATAQLAEHAPASEKHPLALMLLPAMALLGLVVLLTNHWKRRKRMGKLWDIAGPNALGGDDAFYHQFDMDQQYRILL